MRQSKEMQYLYDLAIVYRIYPLVSSVPLIHKDNKFELSRVCAESFNRSLGDMRVKIWILLDGCPHEYKSMLSEIFKTQSVEFIELEGEGNAATFSKQIEILTSQNESELVYFAEDDYFYLDGTLKKSVECLKELEPGSFISLYDSADYYDSSFHGYQSSIQIVVDTHWRTVSSSCLTFMTSKTTLNDTKEVFMSYVRGNFDSSLWISLTKLSIWDLGSIKRYFRGEDRDFIRYIKAWKYGWKQILFGKKYNLFVPIPGMATHLEKQNPTPTIDWLKEISKNK